MFVKNEHQKYMANIFLIYLILEVNWDIKNTHQKAFVKYLNIASIIDTVRPIGIQKFIDELLFQYANSIISVVPHAETFLPHM